MHWRMLGLFMVFVGMAHFNRISITVAGAEKIIPSGQVSAESMGLVYSSFLLLYTLFMVPGGWFIDRFGPRAGWMLVGFGSALGMALTGLVGLVCSGAAALVLGLLLVRSLQGLANAPLHPTAARLVANWAPPGEAALANGLITAAACVGIASTYLVFGLLLDTLDWPRAFLVVSGGTVLLALVWTFAASDYPPGRQRREIDHMQQRSPAFGRLLCDRSLICLTLSYGALGYFQYLFFYWIEYYFEHVLHLSKETSRWNSSLLILAMGGGMVLGGKLSDLAVARLGTWRGLAAVPVGGFLVAACATMAAAACVSPPLIFAGLAVALAGIGACEGAFWTAAVRLGGLRGGTAAAIVNTGGNAFGLISPAITPFIGANLGWTAVLLVAAAVCLGGAALWAGVRPADPGTEA